MLEQRFETGFKMGESDEPGLVLGDDGRVMLVVPGGNRHVLGEGSATSLSLAPSSAAQNLIQPSGDISAITLRQHSATPAANGQLAFEDSDGRFAMGMGANQSGAGLVMKGGAGSTWTMGIDSAAPVPFRDFYIAKSQWPSPGEENDIFYISHNGDMNPTIGIGKTPAIPGYRLAVAPPGSGGPGFGSAPVSEATMGGIAILQAEGQDGHALAITGIAGDYEYAYFDKLGTLNFRPDGVRTVLSVAIAAHDALRISEAGLVSFGSGTVEPDVYVQHDTALGASALKAHQNLWVENFLAVGATASNFSDIFAVYSPSASANASILLKAGTGGSLRIVAKWDPPYTVSLVTTNASPLVLGSNNAGLVTLGAGGEIGFFGSGGTTKPTVTGSRGGNAALASLLTALAGFGLITNSSS